MKPRESSASVYTHRFANRCRFDGILQVYTAAFG
jgi:hypothetical protein